MAMPFYNVMQATSFFTIMVLFYLPDIQSKRQRENIPKEEEVVKERDIIGLFAYLGVFFNFDTQSFSGQFCSYRRRRFPFTIFTALLNELCEKPSMPFHFIPGKIHEKFSGFTDLPSQRLGICCHLIFTMPCSLFFSQNSLQEHRCGSGPRSIVNYHDREECVQLKP